MLEDISVRRCQRTPEIFKRLRLRGAKEKSGSPYDAEFIQSPLEHWTG
jgi:hypothetical protein